jgi:predicted component of type VI protein secretion system
LPTSYVIDAKRRLVYSRAWGVFSAAEMDEHRRAVATDPAFDPSFAQLGDLREVVRFDIETAILRREATETIFAPTARRALVASSDVGYGLSRVYGAHAELAQQSIRVFREIEDAERWLGVSHPAE